MNGIYKIKPSIKKISFPVKGKMKLDLKDEREIIIPVKYFEKIRKLTTDQRNRWYVLDEQMFSFEDCDEVFHIEQVLGSENNYRYSFKKKTA